MQQPLEQKLMNQIRELAVENPYPLKKRKEKKRKPLSNTKAHLGTAA